jgi:hypothetical protein
MPKATPTEPAGSEGPEKKRKRNPPRASSASSLPRQRGTLPSLSSRLGTCCGLDFDHVTGIPRPCSAPPVKAHGLCSAHAEHFEIQQLWRAILRPDWKKTVDTFASSAVAEQLGKRQPRAPRTAVPAQVERAWSAPAPTPAPAPKPPFVMPAMPVSAALARFRQG